MYLSEDLQKKWSSVLDNTSTSRIRDPYRRAVTAVILENQLVAMKAQGQIDSGFGMLNETLPSNYAGTGGYGGGAAAAGPVAGFDPILISLVRRSLPNLIAYDVCGVQPMTGPTGLIFAMRSRYANSNTANNLGVAPEALFNEVDSSFSGTGSYTKFDTANVNPGTSNASYFGIANTGYGYPTANAEDMGGTTAFGTMGFTIEKVTVTANTRGLASGYTLELAQDLKAVHGLDAETELSNILSTEILAEINRELIRTIYATAVAGAQLSNTAGVYNLSVGGDSTGRWQVELYKGLIYMMEREANKIGKDTRRGKGNIVICSTDVASALAMSGLLDYSSGITHGTDLNVDDNGNTFAGTLFGRTKVFVDPYSVSGADYIVVGYKGTVAYDAGLFYCPYVPLQMVRAIDPNTFQPKIGFKTRYGIVANPFAQGLTQGLGAISNNSNVYYRKFIVQNLK